MNELKLAWRRLVKRPASSVASLGTLACAIAAAAVTWSALSAVLIHPLPVKDPEGLLVVGTRGTRAGLPHTWTTFTYSRYRQIQDAGVFERPVAEWRSPHTLLVAAGGTLQRADVGFATYEFFDVLGVGIMLGRGFTADDDRRGAAPVALLAHRYWRRMFDADPSVIGQTIQVAGKRVAVAGILEQRFRGLDLSESIDLYLPFHTIAEVGGPGTNYFAEPNTGTSPSAGVQIVGRLREGVAIPEALSRIAALEPSSPSGRKPPEFLLVDVNAIAVPQIARAGMTRFARLLATTVGLLLFIGCTTVGMLLLIRTEARAAEFAMCMALGASRARLVRGIVWEGVLLAGIGALLSVPVAWWLVRLIQVFQLPGSVSIESLELSLSGTVVAGTVAAAAAAVVLIAFVATVFSFRASVGDALRARSGATLATKRAARAGLVSAQVTVAVMLVTGAGLFARSLAAALSLNAEIDMARLVMGTIELRSYGYTPDRATEFIERLNDRLQGNPAFASVAFSTTEGGMSASGRVQVDGVPRQFPSTVWYLRVDQQYFRTMGIRLLEGRAFTSSDRLGAPPVAIVSESLVRLLAADGPALGRRIALGAAGKTPVLVVGVASDVVANVNVLEPLAIYLPAAQGEPVPYRDVIARAAGDVHDARREIVAAIKTLDPMVQPTPLRTLEERVLAQMEPQQFGATVLGALGAVAILLTLLGVYVLADSMATARMREMGIRAALGASRRQLGSMALAETARLVGAGVLAGLALTWAGARTIQSFLFQVQPLDPITLLGVTGTILILALAVTFRSALRVARVDLGSVLRSE